MKRTLDLIAGGAAFLLALPILVTAAAAIALTMGRPIMFRDRRPGRGGTMFTLLKFRTMLDARGSRGQLLPDEHRLTSTGSLLRSFSIDELPQLWNVLRGDMSLVGPRPLVPRYLERYSPQQRRRLEVKPGITGWAQIHGRNAISWEKKFELDVWYVDHVSFWLDVQILLKTFVKVFRREDINHPNYATMPEFCGAESGAVDQDRSPAGDRR